MYIIVLGAGKVGTILTQYMDNEEHDIVVIDLDAKKVDEIVDKQDVIGVCGNGATYDVLMEAGVDRADLIICVTASDELNILAGLMAKQMGTNHVIARVRNPDYSKQKDFMRNQLGFSMIINPELETANEISRILSFPSATKVDTFVGGKVEMIELRVTQATKLMGLSLNQLHTVSNANILICAVNRKGEVIIPDGDFELSNQDHIYLTGSHSDLVLFCQHIGLISQKIKKIMIIGGGKIAYYLAQKLYPLGIKVKIIESNHERCLALAKSLPFASIIESDGSDEEVLIEEGIQDMDAFIALTGMDEENIVISLYAKQMQVRKAIAKVTRGNFMNLIDSIDIDSFVSPKEIIASEIIRYVRAKMNKDDDSSIQKLYKIVNGEVEAVEFAVTKSFSFLGQNLANLEVKEHILIAAIVRNNALIVPKGDTTIELHDHLIIVTQNQKIKCVNDIIRR